MCLRTILFALLFLSLLGHSANAQPAEKPSGSWKVTTRDLELLISFDGEYFVLAAASRSGDAYTAAQIIQITEWGADGAGDYVKLDAGKAERLQIPEKVYYTQTNESLRVDLGTRGRLRGFHALGPKGEHTRTSTLVIATAVALAAVVVALATLLGRLIVGPIEAAVFALIVTLAAYRLIEPRWRL